MSAQDNKREILQMIRFGFDPDHKRDEIYDASYRGLRCDCKTRNVGLNSKGKPAPQTVTTKRRFDLDSFEKTVLIVSEYLGQEPDQITDVDWLIFPPALEPFRAEQNRKLIEDNGCHLCYNEVDVIESAITNMTPEIEEILKKCRNEVHRNDPQIPKGFFDSEGTKYNRKDTPHPEWLIRCGPEIKDKAKFFRDKADEYIEWLKENRFEEYLEWLKESKS